MIPGGGSLFRSQIMFPYTNRFFPKKFLKTKITIIKFINESKWGKSRICGGKTLYFQSMAISRLYVSPD